MYNKKLILILLAIFCIGMTVCSVSANDIDNSTLDVSYSNEEINDFSEDLVNDVNEEILQSRESESPYLSVEEDVHEDILQSIQIESIYSSTDNTKISSSSKDKLGITTWSGEDTETFYFRLITKNYEQSDSFEQIIAQRIHSDNDDCVRDIFYYVFNSEGKIVYDFIYSNTQPYQVVYFAANSQVFSNLPAGTYKCILSERPIDSFDEYNTIPGYYAIKWQVVKNSPNSQSKSAKTTLVLKTVKIKKSAKKLVLQATLKKGKTPLKNKKITFKFNGKTYKAKTNKKGVAKVTITKKILKKLKIGKKIKYKASYSKITVKKSVKVKK